MSVEATAHEEEEWLSMGEAARRFGSSSRILKRLLVKEGITVLHLNRNYRVRASDVERLREARTKPIDGASAH